MSFSVIKKETIIPDFVFIHCNYAYRLVERIDEFKSELYEEDTFLYLRSINYFDNEQPVFLKNEEVDKNLIDNLINFEKENLSDFDGVVIKPAEDRREFYLSAVGGLNYMEFCACLKSENIYKTIYYQTEAVNILYLKISTESG